MSATLRSSLNGTQPNFATCSQVSQFFKMHVQKFAHHARFAPQLDQAGAATDQQHHHAVNEGGKDSFLHFYRPCAVDIFFTRIPCAPRRDKERSNYTANATSHAEYTIHCRKTHTCTTRRLLATDLLVFSVVNCHYKNTITQSVGLYRHILKRISTISTL